MYVDDCYFCLMNIVGVNAKKLGKYKYPEVSSVSKPVPRASNDPLPICPGTSASSMGTCSPSSTSIGSDFNMEEKHLVSQSELNDLVRDLNLSKQKSELLASRMQEGKFPENLGDTYDEQGERLHQDLAKIEKRYQGFWDEGMMSDYCWTLMRETDPKEYKRLSSTALHF